MTRLHRVRALLLAGLAGCCGEEIYPEADVDLSNPSPQDAVLLERCVVDRNDCEPLCTEILKQVAGEYYDAGYYYLECSLTLEAGVSGPIVHIVYHDGSVCGRAPIGLATSGRVAVHDEVGAWLARAAHLEAASVVAFTRLAVDLGRLGAPRELIARAIASARDEVRHAELLGGLARARGLAVVHPRCAPYVPSTLLELAIHNASEGCARETIGSLINAWQAQHARDGVLRAAFTQIARDEARHAELSWQLDAWLRTQLASDDLAQLDRAHMHALAQLVGETSAIPDAARDVLGLPDRTQVARFAVALVHGQSADATGIVRSV